MARIISGGLQGFPETREKRPASKPMQPTISKPEQQPEGFGSHLLRNIAQAGTTGLYELARSGFGLGAINKLLGNLGQKAFEALGVEGVRPPEHFVTSAQAAREAKEIFPEYLQRRPEDYWTQLALREIPLIAATGGLKSLGNLGTSLLSSLGILGGSELGGLLGGEVGKALGDEEIGADIGSLGGGLGGGALAQAFLRRPSKTLAPEVERSELAKFEAGKAKELGEATKVHKEAELALPKEKMAFEKTKKSQIGKLREEVTNYKNKIKELDESRGPLYKAAEELEGKAKGSPSKILDIANTVNDELGKGINPSDQAAIVHNLKAIENATKTGELSLKNAKTLQKNFNDQIFDRSASVNFKRQMNKLTGALNEFIENTGSPEHNKNWKQAEAATREMKQLKKAEKDFVKQRNLQERDIAKEKFSPEKEVHLKGEAKEAKAALEAIGKRTYEDLVKSTTAQDKFTQTMEKITDTANKWGLSGLGLALGYLGFGAKGSAIAATLGKITSTLKNEIKIARNYAKTHPQIYKQYKAVIADAIKGDTPKVLNRLNEIGRQIQPKAESKTSPEERKVKGGRIISGGLNI